MVKESAWVWVRAPRGPIPKTVQNVLRAKLERRVRRKWNGRCRSVVVRFRGNYAYVDAFPQEDCHMPWHPPEQRVRIAATAVRLCRLSYLGGLDRWQYTFYTYSDDKYVLSVVASGAFEATPARAFDCAARVYLVTV